MFLLFFWFGSNFGCNFGIEIQKHKIFLLSLHVPRIHTKKSSSDESSGELGASLELSLLASLLFTGYAY